MEELFIKIPNSIYWRGSPKQCLGIPGSYFQGNLSPVIMGPPVTPVLGGGIECGILNFDFLYASHALQPFELSTQLKSHILIGVSAWNVWNIHV